MITLLPYIFVIWIPTAISCMFAGAADEWSQEEGKRTAFPVNLFWTIMCFLSYLLCGFELLWIIRESIITFIIGFVSTILGIHYG
jgi:hypothetical protein